MLLAQLVQKGTRPVLNPPNITLSYSAVSNPLDPILSQANVFNGIKADGTTYKSNFADIIPAGAYDLAANNFPILSCGRGL